MCRDFLDAPVLSAPRFGHQLDWAMVLSYGAQVGRAPMVEKTIELTGTSANSIEDAVNIAVSRAAVTIESIRQVRIKDISATIEKGAVSHWRVKIDLSFAVQDRLHE